MTDVDAHKPTLADVAARAGVSASTASLAFSGTGPVSDATRERVLRAARELNYAGPDPRARSLRRGRSGIVGIVLEERVRHAFRDPIKIATLDGIAEEIGAIDAALLVLPDIPSGASAAAWAGGADSAGADSAGADSADVGGAGSDASGAAIGSGRPGGSEATAPSGVAGVPEGSTGSGAVESSAAPVASPVSPVTLADAPLDAAVLLSYSPRLDASIAVLRARGVPLVAIEGDPGVAGIVHIGQDNREAVRLGARHLRELGHERVATIALPLDREHSVGPVTAERLAAATTVTSIERLQGVRDEYPDAPALSASGSFVEAGRVAARELLDVPAAERPTAIIAQSDLLAAGVIRAAEDLGLEVPGDLSVIGFDGVRVEGLWPYDLTTLVQPAFEKGRAAGQAIVRMLAGQPAESTTFTSEFHLGNTTAPPRSTR